MKNAKHLQGICNNLIISLTRHPDNYYSFWKFLHDARQNINITLDIFHENVLPDFLTREEQNEIIKTIKKYNLSLLEHFKIHNINITDIKSAMIHIKIDFVDKNTSLDFARLIITTTEDQEFEGIVAPNRNK